MCVMMSQCKVHPLNLCEYSIVTQVQTGYKIVKLYSIIYSELLFFQKKIVLFPPMALKVLSQNLY